MRHDLDYMIAVMQAAKEGKEIEIRNCSDTEWIDDKVPLWDWHLRDYRIKPEEPKPEYVPYESAEEFLQAQKEHGLYIMMDDRYKPYDGKNEECLWYVMPIEVSSNSAIFVRADTPNECTHTQYGFKYLVDYAWQDGTPVGKLKQ